VRFDRLPKEVNPLRIRDFSTRAAGQIADSLGTQISINGGIPFMAHVSLPSPLMDLEMGGFRTTKSIKVRWPVGRAARPAVGSQILLVAENMTFRVETSTALPGSPLSAEVHVTAIRE